MLKPGIYQHYKGVNGGLYLLIGVAKHESTEEDLVVYQAQYGGKQLFVRPLDEFEERVEWLGEIVPRFKFVSEK